MDITDRLARIDREWERERQGYLIKDRTGVRQVPTTGLAIGVAVGGGVLGAFVIALALGNFGAPTFTPISASGLLVLLGVAFILVAGSFGIYCYWRALAYEKAFADYQARRNRILGEEVP
jgi:hypothetical protein